MQTRTRSREHPGFFVAWAAAALLAAGSPACYKATASPGLSGGGEGGTSSAGASGGTEGGGTGQLSTIEGATVFAFSQVGPNQRDPQLLALKPDVVIRAWAWWDVDGHRAADYDFSYVRDAHQAGILFTGGGTASVLFRDEFPDEAQFDAIVTRDASGAIPPRTTPPVLYRATLANPDYRDYLVAAAKLQIDGGVDALFFDELNAGYSGVTYDGNEGF